MEEISFAAADGRLLHGQWVGASTRDVRSVAVVHSATGVPYRFYLDFAGALAEAGIDVLLWDARGIGASAMLPLRRETATMRDWGRLDQAAALAYARRHRPQRPLVVIGHSSGGHLCGLNPATAQADALVLIASGTCDWRDYPRSQQPRLLAIWWVAMPLLVALFGYLPAWAGIGQALPPGIAREWRRWSLRRGYLFTDDTLDLSGYAAFKGPMLALSMEDDLGFAPPHAVRHLLHRFPAAKLQHRELQAAQGYRGRIGHFGFFKPGNAGLWRGVVTWLRGLGLAE